MDVLLVDDHPIIHETMRAIVRSEIPRGLPGHARCRDLGAEEAERVHAALEAAPPAISGASAASRP